MKITSKPLAAVILVVIFGGIALTTAMNWWRTESSKIPAKFTTGESAGEYNPADIRGSYTFGDISAAFGVPVEVLKTAFGLPEVIAAEDFQVKELESTAVSGAGEVEIGTASVRYFVALYTGLPYTPVEEVYLLQPAVEILKNQAELSAEELAYLESHSVPRPGVPAVEQAGAAAEPGSGDEAHSEQDRLVRGMTTIQEVLDWGVPASKIESILGGELPSGSTVIRSYCQGKGLEFSPIKTALQAEVDALGE